MNFPDLIKRLEMWCDARSKCVWCGEFEPDCYCAQGHTPKDWKLTPESEVFLEAATAIKRFYDFALKFCPKCDDCQELLLEGGIVESDGLHGKPARIVCPSCRAKNPHACNPESVDLPQAGLDTHGWKAEGDVNVVVQTLAEKSAMAVKIYKLSSGDTEETNYHIN